MVREWAQFGAAVDVLDDIVIASSPYNPVEVSSTHSGEVHIFKRGASDYQPVALLEAERPSVGDYFGSHLVMSPTQLLIGSSVDANSNAGAGAAYLYTRNGTEFVQAGYLTAKHGDPQDKFGYLVGLSDSFAVVSAPYEDSSSHGIGEGETDNRAMDSGAVYVFQ
jgi:hypothetical protein